MNKSNVTPDLVVEMDNRKVHFDKFGIVQEKTLEEIGELFAFDEIADIKDMLLQNKEMTKYDLGDFLDVAMNEISKRDNTKYNELLDELEHYYTMLQVVDEELSEEEELITSETPIKQIS